MAIPDDLDDILMVLSHTEEETLDRSEHKTDMGRDLRLEWIQSILDAGRGLTELPQWPIRDLYIITRAISDKNGSATTNERVRMRCIGALGLIHRRYGTKPPQQLTDICAWLFGIAFSSTQDLKSIVSRKTWFILEADRILQQK